jgi:hypothetical protein
VKKKKKKEEKKEIKKPELSSYLRSMIKKDKKVVLKAVAQNGKSLQ